LLHAAATAAKAIGIDVVALHVHHGLVAAADGWLAHGRALCARWARRGLPVTFASTRLDDRPSRGDSVEAWARQARYRALRTMALEQGIDLVLLAHHRRDQAETFLLQYYGAAPSVPGRVIVGPELRDRTGVLAEALSSQRDSQVEVRVASRGDLRRLRELAEKNAKLALAQDKLRQERAPRSRELDRMCQPFKELCP